jgi:outer membrane lipoprotein-sorting protein|tara:strand:+ start:1222 stop:1803 length:582 start_codon:yes stop_codon:yes gene_type:complete
LKLIKKTLLYFLISFAFTCTNAFSNDLTNIIEKINKINSIKFSFIQDTNHKIETGNCLLLFPNKMKCFYFDNKKKELIINDNRMAISLKKYNKVYYYSASKSPLIKILNKDQLIKLIKAGSLKRNAQQIEITSSMNIDQKTTILFDRDNYLLSGWKIKDQFNNNISFLIKTIKINEKYEKVIFKIPKVIKRQN